MIRFEREKQNPFSDDYLLDLLESAVSSDDDPLDLVFDEFRGSVKALIEELLRVEFNLHIGCDPYERTEARNDSRNGFYERDIETVFGVIEGLRVPRTRKNSFKTKLIGRYKRRQKQVGEVIKEMFLRGVSTRRVGMILTPLLGIEPSATTVSNTAKVLDAVVKGYHTRELSDEYIYLILDGVTMKVKEAPHAVRKMVLCAYGITADGRREMIDFLMPREHWKKVRTTNLIERIFREVRRRTNLMGAFANKESCERIIFSVFNSFNDRWQHHPFHNFTQNS